MNTMGPISSSQIPLHGPVRASVVASAIEATGTEHFGAKLLNYLHEACGADYYAVFRLGRQAPREFLTCGYDGTTTTHGRVSTYLQSQTWEKDPAMVLAQNRLQPKQTLLMRVDLTQFVDQDLREAIWPRIQDRLVIAGRYGMSAFSMSILREGQDGFSPNEMSRLADSAELLISLLGKHADADLAMASSDQMPYDASLLIRSLPHIESCLLEMSSLTRREVHVCARILYGMSTTGIALDLDVSTETVKTFRKLAYRRLGIVSEHELLVWYLRLREKWLPT